MITEKAFQEFKRIYFEEIGTRESDDELRKQAESLLALMDAIYKPIKQSWIRNKTNKNMHCEQ